MSPGMGFGRVRVQSCRKRHGMLRLQPLRSACEAGSIVDRREAKPQRLKPRRLANFVARVNSCPSQKLCSRLNSCPSRRVMLLTEVVPVPRQSLQAEIHRQRGLNRRCFSTHAIRTEAPPSGCVHGGRNQSIRAAAWMDVHDCSVGGDHCVENHYALKIGPACGVGIRWFDFADEQALHHFCGDFRGRRLCVRIFSRHALFQLLPAAIPLPPSPPPNYHQQGQSHVQQAFNRCVAGLAGKRAAGEAVWPPVP